jgi:hypothetical protein
MVTMSVTWEEWLETMGGFSFLPAKLQVDSDEESGWK